MANKRFPPCDSGISSAGSERKRQLGSTGTKRQSFRKGMPPNAMFYVESGHVKLTVASKGGKKAVLAILGKGDFFGESCLLKQSQRTTTATALQQSTVSCVKKTTFSAIIRREPAFSNLLVSDLLSRIGRIEEDFTDQLLNSSERRLARLLLRLSHFGKRPKRTPPSCMSARVPWRRWWAPLARE